MFESVMERARLAAELRSRTQAAALGERIRAEVPEGVLVEISPAGVHLSGRALRSRFALDAELRLLCARLS